MVPIKLGKNIFAPMPVALVGAQIKGKPNFMAVEQGSTSAQYSLGEIYFDGLGVQESLENAYALFLVAGANGNQAARNKQRMILKEMTPYEIDKAMKITFELLQKIA